MSEAVIELSVNINSTEYRFRYLNTFISGLHIGPCDNSGHIEHAKRDFASKLANELMKEIKVNQ